METFLSWGKKKKRLLAIRRWINSFHGWFRGVSWASLSLDSPGLLWNLQEGLPCWSSDWDSALPLQGTWVQSLVREPRSPKPCGKAKTNNPLETSGCPLLSKCSFPFCSILSLLLCSFQSPVLSHLLLSSIPIRLHAFSSVFQRTSATQDGPEEKDSGVKQVWAMPTTRSTSWKWVGPWEPLRMPLVKTSFHRV